MNTQLKNLARKYKQSVDFIDLINNDDDFADVYSMLIDLNIKFDTIEKIRFLYVKNERIDLFFAGEHADTHYYYEKYEEDIPPIVRVFDGYDFLGNDGNHRCNTCYKNHVALPVVLVELKDEYDLY